MAGENEDNKLEQEISVEIDAGTDTAVEVQPPALEPKPGESLAVEVVAATPDAPVDLPDPTIELRQQLEELSRKAEEERRAREDEARRRVDLEKSFLRVAAEKEAQDREIIEARQQAVTSALAAEEAEMERAESMMRHANAKNDSTLFVQAQKAMISISSRIEKLKEGQEALAEQQAAIAKRPPINAPPQSAAPTSRDQILSRYTPRTQDYLRNRDSSWLTDPKNQNMLRSAHFAAAAQGLQPDTEAYFLAIDKHMGHGQQPAAVEPAPAPKPIQKSAPAAPPTTKSASSPTGNKVIVKLTPSQVEAAKAAGKTPAEWAKRIHIMSQPGWNGPKFGNQGN
jgi:hypothetical protein